MNDSRNVMLHKQSLYIFAKVNYFRQEAKDGMREKQAASFVLVLKMALDLQDNFLLLLQNQYLLPTVVYKIVYLFNV